MVPRAGSTFSRFSPWRVVAGLAIYTVFLCATPFEHHDLSCELKTPQHCVACTVTVTGANPDLPISTGSCALAEAGRTIALDVHAESLLLAVRTSGRSPPSVS